MATLARIAFLQRSRTDQLLALSRVLHVMQRVLVLKHWHDARKKGGKPAGQPMLSLLEEACIDSSMLAVRALDAFFTARPHGSPKGPEHEICADHFGYPHAGGFLGRERREDLARHIGHITTLPSNPAFHSSLREDLIRAVEPCRKFLTWIQTGDFLDGEDILKTEVGELIKSLQTAATDTAVHDVSPGHLEMPEDVVKATTACLRAAKSPFGPVFSRLMKGATLVSTPAIRRGVAPITHGTVSFPCNEEQLDMLVDALEGIQSALGADSESSRILNWLHVSWSELRRKVLTGEARYRSA